MIETRKLEETGDYQSFVLLNEAANQLRNRGWIQGKYRSSQGFCALGSIRQAANTWPYMDQHGEWLPDAPRELIDRVDQVVTALGEHVGDENVHDWNDDLDTTGEAVIRALEETALKFA